MELTARHFERIPQRNLRIPVREFARLWLTAERRDDAMEAASQAEDAYLRGVCASCEWLAGVIITVRSRWTTFLRVQAFSGYGVAVEGV